MQYMPCRIRNKSMFEPMHAGREGNNNLAGAIPRRESIRFPATQLLWSHLLSIQKNMTPGKRGDFRGHQPRHGTMDHRASTLPESTSQPVHAKKRNLDRRLLAGGHRRQPTRSCVVEIMRIGKRQMNEGLPIGIVLQPMRFADVMRKRAAILGPILAITGLRNRCNLRMNELHHHAGPCQGQDEAQNYRRSQLPRCRESWLAAAKPE